MCESCKSSVELCNIPFRPGFYLCAVIISLQTKFEYREKVNDNDGSHGLYFIQ